MMLTSEKVDRLYNVSFVVGEIMKNVSTRFLLLYQNYKIPQIPKL